MGGSNWFKRQLATNSKELKPAQVRGLSEPGFSRHWSVSVTHRFLRRGKALKPLLGAFIEILISLVQQFDDIR